MSVFWIFSQNTPEFTQHLTWNICIPNLPDISNKNCLHYYIGYILTVCPNADVPVAHATATVYTKMGPIYTGLYFAHMLGLVQTVTPIARNTAKGFGIVMWSGCCHSGIMFHMMCIKLYCRIGPRFAFLTFCNFHTDIMISIKGISVGMRLS